uniref:inositol hexakisphosphate kinase 2-like n=1 Tax=Myxine glutinosa TaxID=7769 RepID=UPI00358ECB97
MSPALLPMAEILASQAGLPLEPLVHQVGGHTCMLRVGEGAICKPLVQREHFVYQVLPQEMRPFTPKYMGMVMVTIEEDEDGKTLMVAYPDGGDDNCAELDLKPHRRLGRRHSQNHHNHHKYNHHYKHSMDMKSTTCETSPTNIRKIVSEHQGLAESGLEGTSRRENKIDILDLVQPVHLLKRPWSMVCLERQLRVFRDSSKHKNHYKFLLLENLVSHYVRPCVLDLKMGTRQHGDDTPAYKVAHMIRKCQNSTSSVLGFRISGMQVYRADTGHCCFMNKHDGQLLSERGCEEALVCFFSNGKRLRHELINMALQRCIRLKEVLEQQDSWRFYSSSLLIVYEGQLAAASDSDSEGLDSMLTNSAGNLRRNSISEEEYADEEGAAACKPCDNENEGTGVNAIRGIMDVRMIDFAHTTCQQFEDQVPYEGPDDGFLHGLCNLIRILHKLKKSCNNAP